jgi:cellulose synthase/poly-beta-1,6-N-acetylglucosamine synthase-like glycosyltransferase
MSDMVVMFRCQAWLKAGFWPPGILTEDININWRLQPTFWRVRFQLAARAWILLLETIHALWKLCACVEPGNRG